MVASLVYFAEHWVIDGLVGWGLVGASFLFWNRVERRQRKTKADRALTALCGRGLADPVRPDGDDEMATMPT
jgi:hypothetical protein